MQRITIQQDDDVEIHVAGVGLVARVSATLMDDGTVSVVIEDESGSEVSVETFEVAEEGS